MKGVDEYRKNEVASSDSIRIITLLLEGAVNFIKLAEKKLEEGDVAGKGYFISRATAVVAELSSALDMEKGMEIAANLKRLYDFVIDRLVDGNIKNDAKALEEACRVMEIIAEGWKDMEKQGASLVPQGETRVEMGIRI